MLNIKNVDFEIEGLEREYHFLHISDLHAVIYDQREQEERAGYLKPRIKDFSEEHHLTVNRKKLKEMYNFDNI